MVDGDTYPTTALGTGLLTQPRLPYQRPHQRERSGFARHLGALLAERSARALRQMGNGALFTRGRRGLLDVPSRSFPLLLSGHTQRSRRTRACYLAKAKAQEAALTGPAEVAAVVVGHAASWRRRGPTTAGIARARSRLATPGRCSPAGTGRRNPRLCRSTTASRRWERPARGRPTGRPGHPPWRFPAPQQRAGERKRPASGFASRQTAVPA